MEEVFGIFDLEHLVLIVNSSSPAFVTKVVVRAYHALPPSPSDVLAVLETNWI